MRAIVDSSRISHLGAILIAILHLMAVDSTSVPLIALSATSLGGKEVLVLGLAAVLLLRLLWRIIVKRQSYSFTYIIVKMVASAPW